MDLVGEALSYHERGWSIIPIQTGTKKPPVGVKWKPFQTERPSAEQLRKWFARADVKGMAVVLGKVSDGLHARDFDKAGAYHEWAKQFPQLAAELPTVKTARGHHVYFMGEDSYKTVPYDNGELRGEGSYVILPPSLHPDGAKYEWIVPLPASSEPLLTLDPYSTGLAEAESNGSEQASNRARQEPSGKEAEIHRDVDTQVQSDPDTQVISGGCVSEDVPWKILSTAEAVQLAIPNRVHENNHCLFTLARAMMNRRKVATSAERLEAFEMWYNKSEHLLRPGQSKTEYQLEFFRAVQKAKNPIGANAMVAEAERNALSAPTPAEAIEFSDYPPIQMLIKFCREMQRLAGDKPFYLGCRTVGKLLKVTHNKAADHLNALQGMGLLELVEPGAMPRAARYRYLKL